MSKAIPDRWLKYQPIGQRVPSTRFIAFKVPLSQNVNSRVDEELRLAPHSLLESVPNLGLIVDLTNTNRYYNPQDFTDQNVEHQKLMIPGHHTPPKELAQRFCGYVTNFLEANADNDKLIGVHCTHGVNRTGYLICYFMITNMKMSPKLAIQVFAKARGHQIERENYTSSLLNLNLNLHKRRHASDDTEHIHENSQKVDRHYPAKQRQLKMEQRDNVWRQDESSWQQQHQEQQQQRQQRRQQYEQRYNQDQAYDHDERRQRFRPQRRWQNNEFERPESQNQKYNYNCSYDQREENWQTRQPRSWRQDQNDDYQSYRRGNNSDNQGFNSKRNNSSEHFNYRRNNSHNYRQEEGTRHNRFSRFQNE